MFCVKQTIILASSSPRRHELMHLLGIDFEVVASDAEEVINNDLSPIDVAMRLAETKALAVAKENPDKVVLGCDTIVVINNDILGKPKDAEDALTMLSTLSGQLHQVITGCAIVINNETHFVYDQALVRFKKLSDQEKQDYIETGEPFGKAGAYAIQGFAAKFIEYIEGDYYSIMGLPISKLYRFFKDTLK